MAESVQVGETGSDSRTIIIAIDDSEYAEYAFDCKCIKMLIIW